jgi:F0F1-type ATP synthase membrane subunit c/vacuolar-type H+-ATPase subunit K
MSSETSQAHMQTLWIIFGALCMSQLIYGVVGVVVVEPPEEPDVDMVLPIAFSLVAISTSVFTFFVGKIIKGNYLTSCIIKWALTESVAIYGFVLYFLTGDTIYLGGFILFSLALMAVHAPKKRDFEDSLREQS